MLLHILMRLNVIAIRHATTPPRLYREYFEGPLSQEMFNDALMLRAWAEINEDQLTKEINKSMLKNEINPTFFTFRVLLHVYPPMHKYLLDDKAYENELVKWQYSNFISSENKIATQVGYVLENFKRAQYKKDVMLQKYSPTDRFDQDWNFINSLVFNKNHPDLGLEFKGSLWIKELFLISEAHVPNLNLPLVLMIAMALGFEFMIVDYCWSKYYPQNLPVLVMKPNKGLYLTYNISCALMGASYVCLSFTFLFLGALDVKRRNYQMHLLSSALQINF